MLNTFRTGMHTPVAAHLNPSCVLEPLNFLKCFPVSEIMWACDSCTSPSATDGLRDIRYFLCFQCKLEQRQDWHPGYLPPTPAHSHHSCPCNHGEWVKLQMTLLGYPRYQFQNNAQHRCTALITQGPSNPLCCFFFNSSGEEENEAISDRLQNVWSKRRWTAPKINSCSAPLKREGMGSDNCPDLFLLSHPCTEVLILASSTLQVHVPFAL